MSWSMLQCLQDLGSPAPWLIEQSLVCIGKCLYSYLQKGVIITQISWVPSSSKKLWRFIEISSLIKYETCCNFTAVMYDWKQVILYWMHFFNEHMLEISPKSSSFLLFVTAQGYLMRNSAFFKNAKIEHL